MNINIITRRKRMILVGFTSGLLLLSIFFLTSVNFNKIVKERDIRIASKPKGNYRKIIDQISERLKEKRIDEMRGYCLKRIDVVSEGSQQTINQIISDSVDIGIVQGNSRIKSDYCGVIAKLYDEVYLAFSNDSSISSIPDIQNASQQFNRKVKIGCLGVGSQSLVDLTAILKYYKIDTGSYDVQALDYESSAKMLTDKRIDLAFYITGLHNPYLDSISRNKLITYVNFPDAQSLVRQFNNVDLFTVSKGEISYGFPKTNFVTLSTPALLIGTTKKNNIAVYDITKSIFTHKNEIENGVPYFKIDTPPVKMSLPYHPGTISYFNNTPSFFVQYGDLVQLILASLGVLVSIGGLVIELRKD